MVSDNLARQNVATRAQSLLSLFLEQAGHDLAVLASFGRCQHLAEIGERLRQRMLCVEGYPNPAYNGLAEAVARCIALYEDVPDQYARLVRGICAEEAEMFLDAFEGLWRLDILVAGLADDHDYVFSESSGTIERSGPANRQAQGLTPARFLTLVINAGHRQQAAGG